MGGKGKGKEFEVGYGKPPKSGQFKKGKSGNSKGRPKGGRGLKTDLKAELNERITINENGRRLSLTKQQLMVKQLATQALKGDIRAITKLVDVTQQVLGVEDEQAKSAKSLSASDAEILRQYLMRKNGGQPNE